MEQQTREEKEKSSVEKARLLSEMKPCYQEWNSLLATLTSEELFLPGRRALGL
jgi:hypothetical protein